MVIKRLKSTTFAAPSAAGLHSTSLWMRLCKAPRQFLADLQDSSRFSRIFLDSLENRKKVAGSIPSDFPRLAKLEKRKEKHCLELISRRYFIGLWGTPLDSCHSAIGRSLVVSRILQDPTLSEAKMVKMTNKFTTCLGARPKSAFLLALVQNLGFCWAIRCWFAGFAKIPQDSP